MKCIKILLSILTCSLIAHGQEKKKNLVWDKEKNIPIEFATIKGNTSYLLGNKEGYFDYSTAEDLKIQNISHKTLKLTNLELSKNDTIFLMPKSFEPEEVIISKESLFKKMLKTIASDYALEPHTKKFYLRVVVNRNNQLYKIIDFSGIVEKLTLFGTLNIPFTKKKITVKLDNVRKVGIENKEIDYELYNFNNIFKEIATIYMSPEYYNFTAEISDDKLNRKIITNPINPPVFRTLKK